MRILCVLGLLAAPLFVWAETPAPVVGSSREAFLRIIDRPRVPLGVEEKEMVAPAGRVQSHVTISSEEGQRVPAIILRPADAKPGTKFAVVIVLHGTSSRKESNLGHLKALADRGFFAVAPDGRYHGERITEGTGTEQYFGAIAKAYKENDDKGNGRTHPWLYDTVWDVMRLIDYLETRPDVDAKRIGVMGYSKGGMETYLLAAADPRVAVAVPCIGVQTFNWGLENEKWQARVNTVKGAWQAAVKDAGVEKPDAALARKFFDRVLPGITGPFDGPQILPTIAPRPLLVINADKDANTPVEGVKIAGEAARKAYEKAGAGGNFELIIQEDTGHTVKAEAQGKAYEWLVRHLKP